MLRIFQDCHSIPVVVMLATVWYCLFLISVIVRSLFVTSVVTLWTALQSKSIALICFQVVSCSVDQTTFQWTVHVRNLIVFVPSYKCRSFCICVQGFKICTCKTLPPPPKKKKNYMELAKLIGHISQLDQAQATNRLSYCFNSNMSILGGCSIRK